MAENSRVEWTDHTFNPWIGCTKVSPACDHCYAESFTKRTGGPAWGHGQPRRRTSDANWRKPLAWDRKAAKEGRRYRVFCASLADVFDAEVSGEWRNDLFMLIDRTPSLDWLLLTKRPAVARKVIPETPRPNVWLGTTVENQAMAEVRIPLLLETPAAVRFLSMEPLLGPVDLRDWTYPVSTGRNLRDPAPFSIVRSHPVSDVRPGLDWVIVGGESGPKARPMHPDWARYLRDQCAAAGVPFFFKQWGEWGPTHPIPGGDLGGDMRADRVRIVKHEGENDGHFRPGDVLMGRVGKSAAGHLLDGVEHRAVPGVSHD